MGGRWELKRERGRDGPSREQAEVGDSRRRASSVCDLCSHTLQVVAERGDSRRAQDPPRLLAARSQFAYTDRLDQAMHDEPEAVSASEQRHLTELGHRRDRERRLAAWRTTRSVITAAPTGYQPFADAPTKSDLRVLSRVCEKIDRRLAGQ